MADHERPGVSQRFVVTMLGQKLPHEPRFFKANLGGTTVIVMTQVADEHAAAAEAGFAMALDTLRYQPETAAGPLPLLLLPPPP